MSKLYKKNFGRYIHHISNGLKCTLDRQVECYGITGVQSKVLGHIKAKSKEQDVYQKDIEEEFKRRKSSITSILQNMEKNGYITRESVKSDARLKKIVLTQKGMDVSAQVYETIVEVEQKVLEDFTQEEKETFLALLEKAERGLEKIEHGGSV